MKREIIIVLFFLNFLNLFADNSADTAIKNNITKYKMRTAHYKLKPFISNMSPSQAQKFFGEHLPYDIILGNGNKVKLSYLIGQMGYNELAKNLKFGEKFTSFAISLGSSIGGTGLLIIMGASFMLASVNQNYNITGFDTYKNNFFISGIVLLGISALSLVEIVALSVLLYKSSKHHLTELQVKSLISQYNKFLQNKFNIILDPDLSYDFNKNINISLGYKF